MASDVTSLNRVRYSGLDFDSISDELRAQLQVNFAASFNDFSVSSLGIVLLDVVSFGLDTLSFYIDRRATDTYLATARTKRSVALLTRQLGYKMGGAVAASTDLSIAVKAAKAFPVPIPAGWQFKSTTGVVFETAQAVTIPALSTAAVTVPAYQGTTVSETFVSDGTPNQTFNLTKVPSGNAIVQGTAKVSVNGAPFTEQDFVTFDLTDQFEINYGSDPPTLRFGDGVAGNIPIKGGSIVVTYVATLGAAGQMLSHTITQTVAPLVVMAQTIDLVIDNPENTVGGADPETLDHAKTFAPRVFKSRRVAVTRLDYESLAGSYADPLFGRVAVAQAVSARSADSDLQLKNLLVDINAALTTASTQIKAALTAFEFLNAGDRQNGIVTTPAGVVLAAADVGKTGKQLDDNTHWVLTSFGPPLVWTQIQNYDSGQGAFTEADLVRTDASLIQSAVSSLVTKTTKLNTFLTSVLASGRVVVNSAGQQSQDYTDAAGNVTSGRTAVSNAKTLVAGFTVAGATTITAGDQNTLLAYLKTADDLFASVNVLLGQINALAGNMQAAGNSIISNTQDNQNIAVNLIGVNTNAPVGSAPPTLAYQLASRVSDVQLRLGSAVSPYTGLYANLYTVLGAQELAQSTVQTDTTEIYNHVDAILSADCKANLVVVPILARDAAGFYAAPSVGLIKSLQNMLDTVKEVTQTVAVTSGANALIPAALKVRIAVSPGISEQITKATATTIIDGVLRDRPFGQSLYVSDLINPIRNIPGVSFANVVIEGYRPVGSLSILTDLLDSSGNLIIAVDNVVTLSESDLSITTEVSTS